MAMYEMDSFDQEKKNQRKEVASNITQMQNPSAGQQQVQSMGLLKQEPQQISGFNVQTSNVAQTSQIDGNNKIPRGELYNRGQAIQMDASRYGGAMDRAIASGQPIKDYTAAAEIYRDWLDKQTNMSQIEKDMMLKKMKNRDFVIEAANNFLGMQRPKNIQEQMFKEAKDFREDIPEMAQAQGEELKRQGQASLDAGIKDIRKGMSSRGLLYSGLRQGKEAGLRGQVAMQMARGQAEINSELEDLARAKEYQASRYGLQGYEEALTRYENLYNKQMENALRRRKQMSQIAGAAGYAAGTAMGWANENKQDNGLVAGQSYIDYSGYA